MLQKSRDPATTQLPQRQPSKNHVSRKLSSLSRLLKKKIYIYICSFFSSHLEFFSFLPRPHWACRLSRETVWLTKLEDQRLWWITPYEFHLCCLAVTASAQGLLMCLWVCTNTTPFFPLNHLRVKHLSSGSSAIHTANMTCWIPLLGTTDQRPRQSVWGHEITGWLGLHCYQALWLQARPRLLKPVSLVGKTKLVSLKTKKKR